MKTGEEIGVFPISCETKVSSTPLSDELRKINDILYKYAKRPISAKAKERVLGLIEALGNQTKDIRVQDAAEPKKKEILTKLRTMYTNVRAYQSDETPDECQKVINYWVAWYIKEKEFIAKMPYTTKDVLDRIENVKEVWEDYVLPHKDEVKYFALEKWHKDFTARLTEMTAIS